MMLCMHALLFPHRGRGRRQRYPTQGNAQARDSDEPRRHHHAAAPSTHPCGGTGNRPPRLHPDADSPRDFTCRWDTVPGNRGTPPPPPELAGDGARRARRQRALGMGRPGCPCHARNPGRMRTGLARPRLPPAQGMIVTCPVPHPPLVSTVRGRQGRRPRSWPT